MITPAMGSKDILVALFSSLLGAGKVPLQSWIGAACSTAAIGLLYSGKETGHRKVHQSGLLAICSAASYGFNDVLLQKWVSAWGREITCLRCFYSVEYSPSGSFHSSAHRSVNLRPLSGAGAFPEPC